MKKFLFAAAVAMLGSVAANAATVVTTNGYITGANGIVANGTTYNVTFNNLCSQAYGSCSTSGTFAFTDDATATTALQALRDQVFTAGDTRQIQGCNAGVTASNCYLILGYLNSGATAAKLAIPGGGIADFPLSETDYGNASYTAFAAATAPVPEPATWAMMMLGFGGMGYAMRRKAKGGARVRFA